MTISTSDDPRALIVRRAETLGFDICRMARVTAPWPAGARLEEFLAAGRHGSMAWMATTAGRRAHPKALWRKARSAVVLGMNYGPDRDPLEALADKSRAAISVYARNRDYHGLIKGRLKNLAGYMVSRLGGQSKVFVDTAPLMEKPLAALAGLGWQGKHTNLVSREFGSWLFLGSILTSVDLPADEAAVDSCGSCRACLDVCPTKAFPAPYQLDARACLSYLTIEHPGPIPMECRTAMGNRVFGCDDCLAVCPWNKFALAARETKLRAREDLRSPPLAELASLDEAAFRARFAANPIKRIGRDRFLRNVLYAIGNSGDPSLREVAARALSEPDPVVREAAAWAVERLAETPSPARSAPSDRANVTSNPIQTLCTTDS